MFAIRKIKPEQGAEIQKVPIPEIRDDEILVKVIRSTICGTDLHIYLWDHWANEHVGPYLPLTTGHEVAGEIVKKGNKVSDFEIGDLVSLESHVVCHHCYQCRHNQYHVCQNSKILGVSRDGAFAEYLAVPSVNAMKNDPKLNLPPNLMAVQEPMGNAIHTLIPEGDPQDIAGNTVLVLGCGPIGLMSIAAAREMGARKIIASEVADSRREMAKQMGADVIINPKEEDLVTRVREETYNVGADVVLEMSGAPAALQAGLDAIRHGGRLSLLGIYANPVTVDLSEKIIFKGLHVYGIIGRRLFETWYQLQGLLNIPRFREKIQKLFTHEFPMTQIDEAMGVLRNRTGIKVALIPEFD